MSLNERKDQTPEASSDIVPYLSHNQTETDHLSTHPRHNDSDVTADSSSNQNYSRFPTYSLEGGHGSIDSFNTYIDKKDDSDERDLIHAAMSGRNSSDHLRPDEKNNGRPSADGSNSSPPTSQSSSAMLFGTVVIIGAISANVFGFRNSRWAVGKDVHRAWQNYERAAAERQTLSKQRAASQRAREEQLRGQKQQGQQQQKQQRSQERTTYNRAEADAREEFRRAQEARMRADREARSSTRERHDAWERTFRGPDGTYYETSYRMDFDPRVFENIFGGQRRSRNSSNARNPFGMPEEVLEEFLRAAQQHADTLNRSERASGGRSRPLNDDFDPFRFWDRMNNTAGFEANFDPGAGSRGNNNPFGRIGMARYYSVLGLKQGATDAEIKTAYRKEAMKWHPDRYRGSNKEEAEKKFREITEAYNALTGK